MTKHSHLEFAIFYKSVGWEQCKIKGTEYHCSIILQIFSLCADLIITQISQLLQRFEIKKIHIYVNISKKLHIAVTKNHSAHPREVVFKRENI